MDSTTDELYFVRGSSILRWYDAILQDADQADQISKSSATQVSEYKINITTLSDAATYKRYVMSLNELEATFNVPNDTLKEIELRDTSVNKKITFTEDKATLTNARGQDTVGSNSEFTALTTVESIHTMNVNGRDFISPIDLPSLYEHLTGLSLDDRIDSSDEISIGSWVAFANRDILEN